MCELFGASAAGGIVPPAPTAEFMRRSALPHAPHDGWGIAQHGGLLVAHMRKATQGAIALENTQPFVRRRWGATHAFAHNGDLDMRAMSAAFPLRGERPLGETDSEYAFCLLLDWLEPLWRGGAPPGLERRFEVVWRFASLLRPLGPFNFLYSDADTLFVHAHRRRQPDGRVAAPGLHMLRDRAAVLFASVPLSSPAWAPMGEGDLLAVRGGKIASCRTTPAIFPATLGSRHSEARRCHRKAAVAGVASQHATRPSGGGFLPGGAARGG